MTDQGYYVHSSKCNTINLIFFHIITKHALSLYVNVFILAHAINKMGNNTSH